MDRKCSTSVECGAENGTLIIGFETGLQITQEKFNRGMSTLYILFIDFILKNEKIKYAIYM